MELCLKVTRHTLKGLERLRATQQQECGTETTTMMHLYPGVVWGKRVSRCRCCDIENANFFAAELGVTKGGHTSMRTLGVWGCMKAQCMARFTQQKVQVSLQLANERTRNTLMKGKDALNVVRD